jgi:hypothetical protein
MKVAALLWVVAGIALVQSADRLPPGWRRTGPRPTFGDYVLKIDTVTKRSGAASLRIEATPDARPSVAVMQSFDARPFRGTRLRLRGYARLSRVSRWAGLLMRIDTPTEIVFDNMQRRPLEGTRDWRQAEIVLDVPDDAEAINVGAILLGSGTFWIDDFELDTVPRTVATTGKPSPREGPESAPRAMAPAPVNLGFEPGS